MRQNAYRIVERGRVVLLTHNAYVLLGFETTPGIYKVGGWASNLYS